MPHVYLKSLRFRYCIIYYVYPAVILMTGLEIYIYMSFSVISKCLSSTCSHLCLPVSSDDYKCACSDEGKNAATPCKELNRKYNTVSCLSMHLEYHFARLIKIKRAVAQMQLWYQRPALFLNSRIQITAFRLIR